MKETIAAQAAVIEQLQAICDMWLWETVNERKEHADARKQTQEALATSTDSTQILDEVRRAEREKCAKVCESHPDPEYTAVHFECASLIRAMG